MQLDSKLSSMMKGLIAPVTAGGGLNSVTCDEVIALIERIASLEAALRELSSVWRSLVGDGTDALTPAGLKSLIEDYREELAQARAEIARLKQEVEDWHNCSQIDQEEHADLCASENIPPSDCCKPKYCALAPFQEIARLRSQLEAAQAQIARLSAPVSAARMEGK